MSNSTNTTLTPTETRHTFVRRRWNDTVVVDAWKPAEASLDIWIYFNLVSNTILLPILVATILFSRYAKRRRPPLLINMCIVWILSGIFSLLLFYGGTARPDDPPPSFPLCTTQLSLLYGILPMYPQSIFVLILHFADESLFGASDRWAVAVLVLTYHVYVVLGGIHRRKMIPMSLLLMAPYVVQIAFTIAGVIAVMTSNNEVQRSFFYCTLAEHPLSNATSIFVFIICLGIILLKIQLALTFYRNWVALRTARRRFQTPAVHAQIPVLRVLVFGAYVFVGMVCNVIKLFDPHNLGPYLYVAIAGLVVFLVFGTQSHILQAWAFWKWRWRWPSRPAQPPPPLVATPNPLLTVDGYVSSPPANWRDTSILSPVRRIENSNPITTRTTEMQETDIDVPPTPPPKAQIVRRFYTDRELDDNGVRMTRQTTEGRLVASYVDYHQTRSDIV